MVKTEKTHLSLPGTTAGLRPEPDAPPGFPPQPSNTSTSAAAESSRNQNPTSQENGFGRLHEQGPNSSAQQPPRRTSRKRTRPQFYAPPPPPQPSATPRRRGRRPKSYAPPPAPPQLAATPRRRGRPPKARLMYQPSCQEMETRHGNQVSSTPSRMPEEEISDFTKSFQMTSEQSNSQAKNQLGAQQGSQIYNISPTPRHLVDQAINVKGNTRDHVSVDSHETLIDISLTEVPARAGNDQISHGIIDPKILQHVANALHYMAGGALDDAKVKSRSSDINKNLADTLKAISKKHGDITQDCSLESDYMKTLVLLGICKVVQDLQNQQLKDLDISTLDSYYTAVRDAENMKVNVRWLHGRLDEIKEAVKSTDEAEWLVSERNRRLKNIDNKEKELERLKAEIQDTERQLAEDVVMVEELNKKISIRTLKFSQFQHTYLMDGLI